MTRLPERFIEDRALRDAAHAVLEEDLARLRTSLSEQSVASRMSSSVSGTISSRISAGASDVLAQAKTLASDRYGVLALLVGAILLWFARQPLLEWFNALDDVDQDETDGQEHGAVATDPAVSDGDTE